MRVDVYQKITDRIVHELDPRIRGLMFHGMKLGFRVHGIGSDNRHYRRKLPLAL